MDKIIIDKIHDRFSESIQIQIAATELLPTFLDKAAKRVVECLLNGNKVIICGQGKSYINAQLLFTHLFYRYELARPSFSSVLLGLDSLLGSMTMMESEFHQLYKKQLKSVAKEGDVLIAFSPLGNEEAVLNTIHYANSENIPVIAFTSHTNDHTKSVLNENGIEIAIPSGSEIRIIEGHLFCSNLLCEFIDHLLFS